MDKWISFEKKMPKTGSNILLWDAEYKFVTADHAFNYTREFLREHEYTHWMAAPSGPHARES